MVSISRNLRLNFNLFCQTKLLGSKNETIFDRPTASLKYRGSAGPQEQGALDQVPVHRVRELLRGHLQAQRPHDEAQRATVQVQVRTVETGDYHLSNI